MPTSAVPNSTTAGGSGIWLTPGPKSIRPVLPFDESTSSQKNLPAVASPTSANTVLRVKLNGPEQAVDPPLVLQVIEIPFVKLNVLPFAAGA